MRGLEQIRPHIVLLREADVRWDTRIKKVAVSLQRMGLRVTILCRSSGSTQEQASIAGVTILRIPAPPTYSQAAAAIGYQLPLRSWRTPPSPAVSRYLFLRRSSRILYAQALRGRALSASIPKRVTLLARSFLIRGSEAVGAKMYNLRDRSKSVARRRTFEPGWNAVTASRSRNWREHLVEVKDLELPFVRVIDELDPDVIHSHDVVLLGLAVDVADRARLRHRRVAIVYDAIENWAGLPAQERGSESRHEAFLAMESECIHRSAVLTTTDDVAESLVRRYSLATKPVVILNVPTRPSVDCPTETVRSRAGVPAPIPLLVYAGGISPARGIDTLLSAMVELQGVHLAIVPVPWPHPEHDVLCAQVARLGIDERVSLVPPVDPQDIVPFLNTATISVHPLDSGAPNHEMTLPNKLFEYAHAGLPLVVSDAKAMAGFVRRHNLGEVFRSGDASDLARCVRRILSAPPRSYLSGDERERWLRRFSWEAQEDTLRTFYEQVLRMPLQRNQQPFPSLRENTPVETAFWDSDPDGERPSKGS